MGEVFRKEEYPEDWEEIARKVKERAGWRCELCGVPSGPGQILTVHHLDRNKKNNSEDNLIALCQRCHLRLHGLRITPKRLYLKGLGPEVFKLRKEDNYGDS